MILVDTSVWIDYLRADDPRLAVELDAGQVLIHPWIIGELALGNLRSGEVRTLLELLPRASVATDSETIRLIELEDLRGTGIAYVDAQLLAATRLTAGARIWTRDKRFSAVAERLGVNYAV